MQFSHRTPVGFQSAIFLGEERRHAGLLLDGLIMVTFGKDGAGHFFFVDGLLVLFELPHQFLLVDIEHDHLLLVLFYLFGVDLDAADECLFLLEQHLFLGGALLESDLMTDAGLNLVDLLVETGDCGDDAVQFCIALASDEVSQLLVESFELVLALLVQGGGIDEHWFPIAAGLQKLRFFHLLYQITLNCTDRYRIISPLRVRLHVLFNELSLHFLEALLQGQRVIGFVRQNAAVVVKRTIENGIFVVFQDQGQLEQSSLRFLFLLQQGVDNI